jgi:hypothetical protein
MIQILAQILFKYEKLRNILFNRTTHSTKPNLL